MNDYRIPHHLSILGIVLLYLILAALAMITMLKLEGNHSKYIIGFLSIASFGYITYTINKYYFHKIYLEPPQLIRFNSLFFKSIFLGVLFAILLNLPYRIYAAFKTGGLEYIVLTLTLDNFIKSLGAGIFEEITFRGTLLNFYNQKKKKYLGLAISSIIFCLIHASNSFIGTDITLFYMLDIFVFGLLFGLIYLNYGLISAIITHFAGNLLIGSFDIPTWYGSYYSLGIALVLCIWLFFRDKNKSKSNFSTKAINSNNP